MRRGRDVLIKREYLGTLATVRSSRQTAWHCSLRVFQPLFLQRRLISKGSSPFYRLRLDWIEFQLTNKEKIDWSMAQDFFFVHMFTSKTCLPEPPLPQHRAI